MYRNQQTCTPALRPFQLSDANLALKTKHSFCSWAAKREGGKIAHNSLIFSPYLTVGVQGLIHCHVKKILLVEMNPKTFASSSLFPGYFLAYSLPPIFNTDVTSQGSKTGVGTKQSQVFFLVHMVFYVVQGTREDYFFSFTFVSGQSIRGTSEV